MTSEKLHANKAIISRFISAITCDWSNSSKEVGLFEIRCLGEKRTLKPKRFSLDAIDEAVDFAISMNAQKLNIYMTINPIDINASIKAGSGATDTDILRAHYSFADADDQAGLTGITKLSELCEPDIVVTTGSVPHERRHAYWGLSETCTDLELWRSAHICLRASVKALDRRPCFQCAAAIRALPSGVLGPVDRPPCSRQRVLPLSGGFWHAVPLRVLAAHRWPGQSGPKLDWVNFFCLLFTMRKYPHYLQLS